MKARGGRGEWMSRTACWAPPSWGFQEMLPKDQAGQEARAGSKRDWPSCVLMPSPSSLSDTHMLELHPLSHGPPAPRTPACKVSPCSLRCVMRGGWEQTPPPLSRWLPSGQGPCSRERAFTVAQGTTSRRLGPVPSGSPPPPAITLVACLLNARHLGTAKSHLILPRPKAGTILNPITSTEELKQRG